jgi:hypothetical protein
VVDGGHGSGNTRVGGNLALLYGYVKIGANKNALSLKIEVGDFYDGH